MTKPSPDDLRMRRLAIKVRAKVVAETLGVTPGTFSKWENGEEAVPGTRLVAWERIVKRLEKVAK